jgi:hypothetical protein
MLRIALAFGNSSAHVLLNMIAKFCHEAWYSFSAIVLHKMKKERGMKGKVPGFRWSLLLLDHFTPGTLALLLSVPLGNRGDTLGMTTRETNQSSQR